MGKTKAELATRTRERDEATEFANRAERRGPRAAGPRDHLPRRNRS